jgi:sulfatase maturation enzyme AslB (radical SAM superfamily)
MSDFFLKVHDHLPVFKVNNNGSIILYTPGFSLNIKEVSDPELIRILKNPDKIENHELRNAIISILKKAAEAVDKWEKQKETPFSPECLTIHVGSECNLNCSYCYSGAGGNENKALFGFPDPDAIRTLFRYIAERRIMNRDPFTVVFHGSGEPTFHWQELISSFQTISTIAEQHRLKIFTYIATNGCLEEEQIDWLSKNMDLIGISCDGPPSIHQKQRPSVSRNCIPIEEVCKRILKNGGQFDIRVTVTPETISQLVIITAYLIEECSTRRIRIEPVYLAGDNGFSVEEADFFYERFTEARKFAEQRGVSLSYSGVRLEEQHGTYCDVLRNTLRLTADDVTRNCFCYMIDKTEYITGRFNSEKSFFDLVPGIQELKEKAFGIPDECKQCINVYHCSRGCPDFCILGNGSDMKLSQFRCRLHQLLAVDRISSLVLNKHN